jgi:drug/metabolite transporter (DMT)-like permease
VPSGLTALLIAATPLWIVVLRLLTRDRPRRVTLIGTLVGFAGVAVLARPGTVEEHVETWGIVLLVCASLSWATGSVIQSRLPLPGDPFVATTYEMLAGGLAMAVVGGARGETSRLHLAEVPLEAWLWMAYLVVFGSLLAFSAFVWLLGNAPISLVATYAYVNPVVAVGLGVLVLDESVTTAVVVGGLVVVAGVALVVMSERPRQRVDRTEPQPEPVA